MSRHTARITWKRGESDFLDRRYSRVHTWEFDGGTTVTASSSPHVVPVPMSDASALDPEEAFVAALSSCHMLFFLSFAAREGLCVDRYVDRAEGLMEANRAGQQMMSVVTLRPEVLFAEGHEPASDVIARLHSEAHHACFLANSVKSRIEIRPNLELMP